MIHVQQSNRLEILQTHFSEVLITGSDPLATEEVVVPNPGMGRWLVHRLAGGEGIAANLDLILPASFFWRILTAWMPTSEVSPFDRDTLAWRIQAVLPGLLAQREFSDLQRYLDGQDSELRLFQLCQHIADLFDQYLVFRPEMVLGWEKGEEEGWQPILWRSITAGENHHRARLLDALRHAMTGPPVQDHLPARIFLFGLNALPPVYLEILRRLGDYREIWLYHLNPCREYWADIRSRKSLDHHREPQAAFLEVGNPLLASFGHVGQAFLDQLLSLEAESHEDYRSSSGDSLLQHVQNDILDLRDGQDRYPRISDEAWPSIQLHGAHTRLREVQILHDNLLRAFEEIEDLTPRDILVMAPDMAVYAPFVEAVFGTGEGTTRIPFSIGDRAANEHPLADAIRWLLGLPGHRFTASEVLAFLEVDAVQRRFGLDDEALERIRTWVRESGIRWGADEAHRKQLRLPGAQGLHSWSFGLRRLFFGYATPADDHDTLYGDQVVPYLQIEGGELLWAGALQELLDRLDHWRGRLNRRQNLEQWREEITGCLAAFFETSEDTEQAIVEALHQRLDGLVEQGGQAGFIDEIGLPVLAELLQQVFDDTAGARGFLAGGVTFSNLLPMRALPYRVICLLGMNASDFPRSRKAPSFDRMGQQPKRTDRDRRRDDRYLFLETLISARDLLLISFVGRDVRSDKPRLPAEPVSELMDYLDVSHPEMEPLLSKRLFVQHPLQPFSRRYYDGSDARLFSYDPDWAISSDSAAEQPFVDGDLETGPVERVELDGFVRFFRNPAEAFLCQRLDLRLPGDEEVIQDTEPFSLDGLGTWLLCDRLMETRLQGQSLETALRHMEGEGSLPHGVPGKLQQEGLVERVTKLEEILRSLVASHPWREEPPEIDLRSSGIPLIGRITRSTTTGILDYRVGRLRGQDALSLWIRHLAMAAQQGGVDTSLFVAENEVLVVGGLTQEDARDHLRELLDLYRAGLRRPLHFFPDTAWRLARDGKKWREAWEGGFKRRGEGDHPAYALVFRDDDPLDDSFRQLAKQVFAPLLACVEKR